MVRAHVQAQTPPVLGGPPAEHGDVGELYGRIGQHLRPHALVERLFRVGDERLGVLPVGDPHHGRPEQREEARDAVRLHLEKEVLSELDLGARLGEGAVVRHHRDTVDRCGRRRVHHALRGDQAALDKPLQIGAVGQYGDGRAALGEFEPVRPAGHPGHQMLLAGVHEASLFPRSLRMAASSRTATCGPWTADTPVTFSTTSSTPACS